MIAVIAEKPSVGRDIARVLNAGEQKNGYYEGNGYMVTWAFGHLVSLGFPEDYGITSFQGGNLPIIPDNFKLINRRFKTKGIYRTDASLKERLKIIEKVICECDEIIVATDAGREGELIFRYIYSFLKCRKPFRRLWISSLTDAAIRQGFDNLRDGAKYEGLYLAAKARSEADWLIGINASQSLCYALKQGNNSLGRVQTPTLAMVCRRYLENKHFQAVPYWEITLKIEKDGQLVQINSVEKYHVKKLADVAYEAVKRQQSVIVSDIMEKKVMENPPLLYDLTGLQKEANTRHGFSAEKTLQIAQKLYEKKLISYPRTASRYIPGDVYKEVPALITSLVNYPPLSIQAQMLNGQMLNQHAVNDEKVTDHHGLLITGNSASWLNGDNKSIYMLIASRMLESFGKVCIQNNLKATMNCCGIDFLYNQSRIEELGWRELFRTESESGKQQIIPFCEEEILPVKSYNLLQKKTLPRPVFTEATLLAAMETAGRELKDEEQRAIMKECGIGTPATRASIIETLLDREYIVRHEKKLIPTKKGLDLFNSVKNMRIADVEMTAGWEKALLQIERDPGHYYTFMKSIRIFTGQIVDEIISLCQFSPSQEAFYLCPKCKRGKLRLLKKIVKCNNSACKYIIFRTKANRYLTDTELHTLITAGMTPVISDFKSKGGKTFSARLKFDADLEVVYSFDKNDREDGNGKDTK